MRVYDNGSFYTVSVSAAEIRDFASRWPCSGMRGATRGIAFQFDKRNGDLVNIHGAEDADEYDGGALLALSNDAQAYGAPRFLCSNCGGPLPTTHGTHGPKGHKFCDPCAGIAAALGIGARLPAFLYDDGKGNATGWTSGSILGKIVHKSAPTRRRFAPARYRVRMLDGSLWHGSGPSENGTYMRLRPMKGE